MSNCTGDKSTYLYSLTLQKASAITEAVYGNFSAPKLQVPAPGCGGMAWHEFPQFGGATLALRS